MSHAGYVEVKTTTCCDAHISRMTTSKNYQTSMITMSTDIGGGTAYKTFYRQEKKYLVK